MTREELLDLLTDAATIGRNELHVAGTRGDVTAYIEYRMRHRIEAALEAQEG